jgi:hypothetical protein
MPSAALLHWQNDRMPRLHQLDLQCAAALAAVPPNLQLIDEALRAYVLSLSAHFQGFCRDLYTECATCVIVRLRPSFRALVQKQFTAHRKLDHGNPNLQNLKADFERFNFTLDLASAHSANPGRLADLSVLNTWRNVAAHQGTIPGGLAPLSLPLLQAWRSACDGLADSLDAIMYNVMRRLLRRNPW